MNDFLEEYTISDQVVDKIVEFYKKNEDQAIQGQVDGGVDKNVKDSKDIVVPTTYEEEPFITYKNELHNCIELYGRKYELLKTIYSFGLIEPLVIQKYSKGGGFKKFHAERLGKFDHSIKRCLVYMTYLNDVEDGGTEFIYQNKTIKAVKGKTVIWPSDWTHSHKGQISHTKEKLIITGWYSHFWDF
jgi:hypothetical protein